MVLSAGLVLLLVLIAVDTLAWKRTARGVGVRGWRSSTAEHVLGLVVPLVLPTLVVAFALSGVGRLPFGESLLIESMCGSDRNDLFRSIHALSPSPVR